VRGTFEVQSRRSFAIRPRRIVVSYGEPMPTEGIELRAKRTLVDSVRKRVGELADLPDAESGAEIASSDGE
jgi:hypothetical protein